MMSLEARHAALTSVLITLCVGATCGAADHHQSERVGDGRCDLPGGGGALANHRFGRGSLRLIGRRARSAIDHGKLGFGRGAGLLAAIGRVCRTGSDLGEALNSWQRRLCVHARHVCARAAWTVVDALERCVCRDRGLAAHERVPVVARTDRVPVPHPTSTTVCTVQEAVEIV